MITKCFHCGDEISNDNHSKDISGGVCSTCWKLHGDLKWYKKNDMEEVSKKIEVIFESRMIIPKAEIEKKGEEAQDYLNFLHRRFAEENLAGMG